MIKTVAALPSESEFKAKIHQFFYFGWGFVADLAGGAYSAPPYLLAVFKGPTYGSKGQEEWKGRGGNIEFHQLLSVI